MGKSLNTNLHKARHEKNDEFYTQMKDIEKEMYHYRDQFKGKHIFLNCDDPTESNFYRYFNLNFEFLELKQLTATHYEPAERTYRLDVFPESPWGDVDGIKMKVGKKTALSQNGDFRSPESLKILEESDIVITNPPFSLFGEYISLLIEKNKNFIIIGNQNDLVTQAVFPLLKAGRVWSGVHYGNMEFRVPNDDSYKKEGNRFWIDEEGNYWRSLGNICWYTNMDHSKRREDLIMTKVYEGNEEDYPRYENYDAIEVGRVDSIPMDYSGVMGVPITFIYKHNPKQFEIIGQTHSADKSPEVENLRTDEKKRHGGYVDGKQKYARILVRNKNPRSTY